MRAEAHKSSGGRAEEDVMVVMLHMWRRRIVMPESCPKKRAKAKMVEYAQEHGIQVDPKALKDVIWQELKPIASVMPRLANASSSFCIHATKYS